MSDARCRIVSKVRKIQSLSPVAKKNTTMKSDNADKPRFRVLKHAKGMPITSWALRLGTKAMVVGFPSIMAARAFATEWWPNKRGFEIVPCQTAKDIAESMALALKHEDNGFL